MLNAKINYIKSPKNDELYTPKHAITPLLNYLPKNAIIWEPTDFGNSNITKILKENGYNVISTHINNFDFLNDKPDFNFDIIITNPPYSIKDDFLKKCYDYNKPFALLLPLTALEGVNRNKLYKKNGIECMIFDRRINFINCDKKNNWFNTSWFCWKLLPYNLLFENLKVGDDQ